MINLLIHSLFITTTIGMIYMELGSYGPTINEYGHQNGATFSYLLFWGIFYIFYFKIQKYRIIVNKKVDTFENKNIFKILFYIFIFTFLLLLIQLFLFNGISVLSGTMAKNEFRTTGVSNGLLAFGILKFYGPGLGAIATFYFLKFNKKGILGYILLFFIYIFLFVIGASWGYKSSGITILFPSLALLFWRISLWKFLFLFLVAMFFFAYLALQFDTAVVKLANYSEALTFIFERITVFQSETPWKIWDSYINGIALPKYIDTIIGLLGNTIPRIFGVTIDYISSNYGLAVTYFVYPHEQNIINGFNTTSTFYSEAIIAFGYVGLLVFPMLGGTMAGIVVKMIQNSNKAIEKSILLLLFFSCIFPWMSSGGISTLFHISIFFHLLISYIIFKTILTLSTITCKKGNLRNVVTH